MTCYVIIIQRKDDKEGYSPEVFVAKSVLHKLSRVSGDIFHLKPGKDGRASAR